MVRLTERLDMTIAVDWNMKSQTKHSNTPDTIMFLLRIFVLFAGLKLPITLKC